MNLTYHDIKEALYVLQTLFGCGLIFASMSLFNNASATVDLIGYVIPAIVLMIVGITCVLFGAETYFLRDDPDVWR